MTIRLTTVFALIGAFLLIGTQAYAESVVWSQLQPDLRAPGNNSPRAKQSLLGAMVNITYNAQMLEVDADGATIRALPNGSTVAAGSRIRCEFVPHKYTDIHWFATGDAWDSPYGDWLADAAEPPAAERCAPKNLYWSLTEYSSFCRGDLGRYAFAQLSVAPPAKTLTVTGAGVTCTDDGGDKVCTLASEGTATCAFAYGATTGKFYNGNYYIYTTSCKYMSRLQKPASGNACNAASASYPQPMGNYTMPVPAQSISIAVNVGQGGEEPTPPTTTRNSSNSGNACVVGTTLSLTMTSSDPGGKQIRYGVDWDANGTVDQYAPGSGYVNSGTTQTATRTFATPGPKTVKAFAQNEDGATSAWTTIQFVCGDAVATDLDDVDDGNDTAAPGDNTPIIQDPDLSIRALPSLVRSGEATRIHWSATNVEEGSCRVTGNGIIWTGESSRPGGESSNPITQKTVFTITCTDFKGASRSKSVTVSVLPAWSEPKR